MGVQVCFDIAPSGASSCVIKISATLGRKSVVEALKVKAILQKWEGEQEARKSCERCDIDDKSTVFETANLMETISDARRWKSGEKSLND